MEIRGQRACQACDTEWSYYETGSIACPNCGSLRSVGRDAERRQHTDAPAALPLAEFRNRIAEEPVSAYANDLKSVLREYTRKRGFINGGELRALDDTYLTARTLLHTVDILGRSREPTADEELYMVSLYEALADDASTADDGDTLTGDLPNSLQEAWGLAATDAVGAYSSDLRTWLDANPDSEASNTLGRLREHVKRVEALQGAVDPETATVLVEIARRIGQSLRADNADDATDALAAARDRLDQLEQPQ